MGRWNPFRHRRWLWFFAMLLVLSPPASTSAAGKKETLQIGAPSSIALHVPIPMLPLANLYTGIHRDLASQSNDTREWVPLGGGTGFLKYSLLAEEHTFKAVNGQLISHASLPFWVEYAKPLNGSLTKVAECGQSGAGSSAGRLSVQLSTAFTLRRGYGVTPTSKVAAIEPATPCLLSDQQVDATPLVAKVYRSDLQRVLPAVDRKAAGLITLKPVVARIWKDLEEPILLDEAEALWLMINPGSVDAGGVRAVSETPVARFGVIARPTVVRGAKPVSQHHPLPEAQDRAHEDGFHVTFTLEVPVEEANQRLREAVVGQEWSLGVGRIKIAGATLYPVGKQVGVELILRGLLPLTLRLKGTPAYDEPTGRILFREVDYTIKERTPATDMADEWLHEPLREELARRLVLPIREELAVMRTALQAGLNRNLAGGRLSGIVDELALQDLAVQTNSFSATFKTVGTLLYSAHAESISP
ncbi:MAG TPA: DUF4403 family protein [Nitrospira sp.]|nr:DUF4403 family protein [Nitrospira sp.]